MVIWYIVSLEFAYGQFLYVYYLSFILHLVLPYFIDFNQQKW